GRRRPVSEQMTPLPVLRIPGPSRAPLSDQSRAAAKRLMDRYPDPRSALLPILYLIQAEHGYVSREGIREVAGLLGLSPAEVTAVATFYTMFKREPAGRWIVSVCTQPPCALRGANQIREALENELGITCGQTTEDGLVSIEDVECLCVCDGAPVVGINYENYEGLNAEQVLEIVRGLRAGQGPPPPKRGEAPKPWDEAHRELSGLNGVGDGGSGASRLGPRSDR
ncbi:MAG: NADH-quinone oxidoreductase subunit NuoE, partial [Actinomycetota bacterium]